MQPGEVFAPFRFPAFRAIWIANMASSVGSTIQAVAAAWLMTDLTSSHRLLALVQASTTLPIMLFGLIAGVIADNFDRRRVMLAAQISMLVAAGVLAALTWSDAINPVLLLALTLSIGIGTALNSPAWQASVRQQVGAADLPQAISLNSIAFNLARSVGPALGGLLISLWNVGLAFAINSASYIIMIVVLLRWKPETTADRQREPMLSAIVTGVTFCARSVPIRKILSRGLVLGFGIAGYQALVPAVVRDRLHGTEIDFGLLLGLFGIGSILTALWIGKVRRRFGSEFVMGAGTFGFALALLGLSLARSLLPAMAASFIGGTAWVATLTTINIAMQLRSPEAILGRCLSMYQAVTFGGMAMGAWVWGAVADGHGLPFALRASAAFLAGSLVIMRTIAPMPKPGEGRVNADGIQLPSR